MNTVPIFARFVSYDYDAFAASNVPIVSEAEYDELLSSLEQTATVKVAGNDYTLSPQSGIVMTAARFSFAHR